MASTDRPEEYTWPSSAVPTFEGCTRDLQTYFLKNAQPCAADESATSVIGAMPHSSGKSGVFRVVNGLAVHFVQGIPYSSPCIFQFRDRHCRPDVRQKRSWSALRSGVRSTVHAPTAAIDTLNGRENKAEVRLHAYAIGERLDVAIDIVRLASQVKHRNLVERGVDIYSLATLAIVHVGPLARPEVSESRAVKEYCISTSASTMPGIDAGSWGG